MSSVLDSSAVDCEFETRSVKSKIIIGICFLSAKHAAIMSECK
jgi:hypothetical protein